MVRTRGKSKKTLLAEAAAAAAAIAVVSPDKQPVGAKKGQYVGKKEVGVARKVGKDVFDVASVNVLKNKKIETLDMTDDVDSLSDDSEPLSNVKLRATLKKQVLAETSDVDGDLSGDDSEPVILLKPPSLTNCVKSKPKKDVKTRKVERMAKVSVAPAAKKYKSGGAQYWFLVNGSKSKLNFRTMKEAKAHQAQMKKFMDATQYQDLNPRIEIYDPDEDDNSLDDGGKSKASSSSGSFHMSKNDEDAIHDYNSYKVDPNPSTREDSKDGSDSSLSAFIPVVNVETSKQKSVASVSLTSEATWKEQMGALCKISNRNLMHLYIFPVLAGAFARLVCMYFVGAPQKGSRYQHWAHRSVEFAWVFEQMRTHPTEKCSTFWAQAICLGKRLPGGDVDEIEVDQKPGYPTPFAQWMLCAWVSPKADEETIRKTVSKEWKKLYTSETIRYAYHRRLSERGSDKIKDSVFPGDSLKPPGGYWQELEEATKADKLEVTNCDHLSDILLKSDIPRVLHGAHRIAQVDVDSGRISREMKNMAYGY